MQTEAEQRRAYFRLRYPEEDRPRCRLGGSEHAVTELSEGGMRLHLDGEGHDWDGPEHIRGTLLLSDGPQAIAGDLLRVSREEVVFTLSRGVDLRCMLNEQKHLVRKYPALFGKDED